MLLPLSMRARSFVRSPPIDQATAHSRWRSGRVQVLHRYPRGASHARRRRPPFVTATEIPRADAAALVRRMTGRYRLRDARRRADTLARQGTPAATMSDRQPDLPTQTRGTRQIRTLRGPAGMDGSAELCNHSGDSERALLRDHGPELQSKPPWDVVNKLWPSGARAFLYVLLLSQAHLRTRHE
jgi:hypothetical protein